MEYTSLLQSTQSQIFYDARYCALARVVCDIFDYPYKDIAKISNQLLFSFTVHV